MRATFIFYACLLAVAVAMACQRVGSIQNKRLMQERRLEVGK